MTSEQHKWYGRGYSAGTRASWPLHRPPAPPTKCVAKLMHAARNLRDKVDNFLATIEEDDPLQVTVGPAIDSLDDALAEIGLWLTSNDEQSVRLLTEGTDDDE